MSILLLVPRSKMAMKENIQSLNKMVELSKKAAEAKTHFVVTIDPDEFEVFTAPGSFEEIHVDESGGIRLNLTMFDFDG